MIAGLCGVAIFAAVVGVGLCSILAIVLNLILPRAERGPHDGVVEGQDV